MKYCSHCGKAIRDEAVICIYCGCQVPALNEYDEDDEPSTGLNIVGFLFPLIGLILFLVFHENTPNKANKIGKWALIGFLVGVVGSIVLGALYGMILAAL